MTASFQSPSYEKTMCAFTDNFASTDWPRQRGQTTSEPAQTAQGHLLARALTQWSVTDKWQRQNCCLLFFVDGSLQVSPDLSLYGNDVLQRSGTTVRGSRRTWIDTNHLLVSGYLSRYYLYANAADRPGSEDDLPSPSVTRIQIWRPAGGAQSPDRPRYTLVWQRRVLLNTTRHGLLCTVSLITLHIILLQLCGYLEVQHYWSLYVLNE